MPKNLYRRGTVWWGRFVIQGMEQRRSLRTDNRKEAERRLAQWIAETTPQRIAGRPRYSFQDAVALWSMEFLPNNVAASTRRRYELSIKSLDVTFGKLMIDEIDKRSVSKFVSHRREMGVTNSTIRRDLTALSSVMEMCIANDWRSDNPALAFDRKRQLKERRDPLKLPSDEDIDAMIALATKPMAGLLQLLRHTGVRLQEGATLRWPQIDAGRREITLIRTKGQRVRVVPLNDGAMAALAAQKRHTKTDLVFWHGAGFPYRNLPTNIAKLIKRANRQFRTHDLRHRFAVDYLKNGGDIYRLSKILGHTSVKTTEIYLNHVGEY